MKKIFFILIPVAIIISIALYFRGRIVHEKFDSQTWKTVNLDSEMNLSLRWDMMNDLRNRYDLVGMTRNEIVQLLGVPEFEIDHEFRYYLGYSKTGINTGSLIVRFDKNNIVREIEVWQG